MKRLALIFAVAVIAPSLLLAWLALRSLKDQQFVLERQQSLLCQGIADTLARNVAGVIEERQREFGAQVETLLAAGRPEQVAATFDHDLRAHWPAAAVGFVVSLKGEVLNPPLNGSPVSRQFRKENDLFLCNREIAEVYWGGQKGAVNFSGNTLPTGNALTLNGASWANSAAANPPSQQRLTVNGGVGLNSSSSVHPTAAVQNAQAINGNTFLNVSNAKTRAVAPQQLDLAQQSGNPYAQSQGQQMFFNGNTVEQNRDNLSRLASAEAEFRQLVGDATEGTVARFLQNKLNVMFWYRAPSAPELVFGALLDLAALRAQVKPVVKLEPAWGDDFAVALLDDGARPVAVAPAEFTANWKRPFVATEVGEALPHWELGVYLRDPALLGKAARTATLTLVLLVGVLVVAIGAGSWLIVGDVRRQLALARQKTDFVSNVSHELKTPLTSIRMFAELLAEGRAAPDKQKQFLGIITAEASRLTRLINNVLDFARLDRGEKRFELKPCDLAAVVGEALGSFRPHLEAGGFTLDFMPSAGPVPVSADRDALAQIVVNLLSNAEKYSNGSRTIAVSLQLVETAASPDLGAPKAGHVAEGQSMGGATTAELSVLDRGPGVPRGCEEKIFEQFYRAHDSLANGVRGSGLGLTLARQIARAHDGDVTYAPREGGGSCFKLRLPVAS